MNCEGGQSENAKRSPGWRGCKSKQDKMERNSVRRRIMDMGITKGVEIYIRKVAPS